MVQKTLRAILQARFKSQVAAYRKAYAALENPTYEQKTNPTEFHKLKEKEVYLRGVVRGAAQILIVLTRPTEHKNKEAIRKLELDYGMPGERGIVQTGSRVMQEFFEDRWSTSDASDWGDAMHNDGLKLQNRKGRATA